MDFQSLGLDDWLVKLCAKINFREPRPIQQLAIPQLLKGNNTLISSQTGTGKTAAFAFPIVQELSRDPYGIYAIVLTASRELALQIGEQFQIFGAAANIRVCLLIGGLPIQRQIEQLSRIPHIVIATPGRCVELLRSDATFVKYIQNVRYFVLDEVDRLMEQQVWTQVEEIRDFIEHKNYQIALVSATLDSIYTKKENHRSLEECFPGQKFEECVANKHLKVAESIAHKYILMPQLIKDYYLIYLLQKIADVPKIIFVTTCHKCQEVASILNKLELDAVPLHSMLKQKERIENLRKFRRLATKTLVATDVAARGLDIPEVKYVINWNIPKTTEDYIHRVGRTARGNKRGTAVTLVTQFDVEKVVAIEKDIGVKLAEIKFNEDNVLEDMATITKVMRKVKIEMAEDGTTEQIKLRQKQRKDFKKQQKGE